MTEAEMREKIDVYNIERFCEITSKYRHFFHEGLVVNCMPLEDQARLEEIVEECIATGKPYDNYMPVPDDENILVDY